MVRPLIQQAQGLPHVVGRADDLAGFAAGLFEESEGVVGSHHVPADSPQAPGGAEAVRNRKVDDNIYCWFIFKATR